MCTGCVVHAEGAGRVVARIDIVQTVQRNRLTVYFQRDGRFFVLVPGRACHAVVALYAQIKGHLGAIIGLRDVCLLYTSNGKSDKSDAHKNKKCCPSPAEIFTTASALSAFLAANLDQREINTVINLLSLVTANLSAVVTQQEICEGDVVQPTI